MAGMQKRIYLDSNVFISLIKTEIDHNARGLFIEVELFLENVKKNRNTLVLSDWFFKEVKKFCYLEQKEIIDYFTKLEIQVETVKTNEKINYKEFAKKGIHFPDSLHIALAVHYNCNCIVTFNIKDFEKAKDTILVFEPKEFD